MKHTLLLLLFIGYNFCLPKILLSQSMAGGLPGKGIDMNTVPGGVVSEIKFSEPITVGNTYLNDQWILANIELYSGQVIEQFPVKYDLANNQIEIKASPELKYLNGIRVKRFTLMEESGIKRVFINLLEYKPENRSYTGFVEVIYDNNWVLLERIYTELIEGTYNAVLDIGERNNKIVKKSNYFISNGKQLFPVERNKKKFSSQFSNPKMLLKFIKNNNIQLKSAADLSRLVDFLSEQKSTYLNN